MLQRYGAKALDESTARADELFAEYRRPTVIDECASAAIRLTISLAVQNRQQSTAVAVPRSRAT
jgi:hypothetical protein